MSNGVCVFVFLALLGRNGVLAEPIQVRPTNPQYCFYQGKAILLITWV